MYNTVGGVGLEGDLVDEMRDLALYPLPPARGEREGSKGSPHVPASKADGFNEHLWQLWPHDYTEQFKSHGQCFSSWGQFSWTAS